MECHITELTDSQKELCKSILGVIKKQIDSIDTNKDFEYNKTQIVKQHSKLSELTNQLMIDVRKSNPLKIVDEYLISVLVDDLIKSNLEWKHIEDTRILSALGIFYSRTSDNSNHIKIEL